MIQTRMSYNAGGVSVTPRSVGQPRKLRGYAAVYYNGTPGTEYRLGPNSYERIMPGAFDRAIREDDVRALFNHDGSRILGRTTAGTLSLLADQRGLFYSISPADTQTAREVMTWVERREITGSSFSFIVTDEGTLKENGRRIFEVRAVKLFDVGPVTFPAYEGTAAEFNSADEAERIARGAQADRERRERDFMFMEMRQARLRLLGV